MFRISQQDLRAEPRYLLVESAHYLRVNPSTLRAWAKGRLYQVEQGHKFSTPVLDHSEQPQLSFINLTEAHVLAALRQTHQIPMAKIRLAVDWMKAYFKCEYPLLHPDLATDGLEIFVSDFGRIISASEQGQVVIREVMEKYLSRLERDKHGVPILYYPFTREMSDRDAPRQIVIDPSIAYGRPVIKGTRITTTMVVERYRAGESSSDLASDYDVDVGDIDEAIRSEIQAA